jgi:hypothetical protein
VWASCQMTCMNMRSDDDGSLSDYDNQMMNHQLKQRYKQTKPLTTFSAKWTCIRMCVSVLIKTSHGANNHTKCPDHPDPCYVCTKTKPFPNKEKKKKAIVPVWEKEKN